MSKDEDSDTDSAEMSVKLFGNSLAIQLSGDPVQRRPRRVSTHIVLYIATDHIFNTT